MNLRAVTLVAVLFFLPLISYAENASGSPQGSSVPDASMGGGVVSEPKPADPVTEVPTATVATATPATGGSVVPRPPAVSTPVSNLSVENPTLDAPVASSSDPVSSDSFPYVLTAVVVALLGAGFGIFKIFSGNQAKSTGDCDEIKKQMDAKKGEESELEGQITAQESAVELAERKLKEKAEDTLNEKKDAVIKKAKDELKGKVFGKDGAPRQQVETAESAYATYEDLEQKFEQAKKLLEFLRSKRVGLSKEIRTLESSYAVCMSTVSAAGLTRAAGGIRLPYASATKAIIFDWGGVISSEVLWNWLKKNIPDIESKKDYFQNIIDAENKGGSPEGLVAVLAKEADKLSETVAIELNLEQTVHVDMVLLIRSLRKKYKIGLLSNANSHLREIISKNNLDDLFDQVLISAEHNLIKPDPAIFNKMLGMLNVKPGDVVFVDDRKKNTDAAHALGLKAILFTSHDALVEELKKIGITVPEN